MLTAAAESTAPADVLWELVSDVPRWSERVPTVDAIRHVGGPPPTSVGSRFEVHQPKLPTAVYEVTHWQPRRFVWVARGPGLVGTATHEAIPTETGSQLQLTYEWSGPLAPLARLLGSRAGQKMIEAEATTFAQLADAR